MNAFGSPWRTVQFKCEPIGQAVRGRSPRIPPIALIVVYFALLLRFFLRRSSRAANVGGRREITDKLICSMVAQTLLGHPTRALILCARQASA